MVSGCKTEGQESNRREEDREGRGTRQSVDVDEAGLPGIKTFAIEIQGFSCT